MNKKIKLLIILSVVVLISILGCILLNSLGLDNISKIKGVLDNNIWGYLTYILLLTLQIMLIPINSLVLIVPAIVIFGGIKAFILSLIGLVLGSIATFYIGRVFGLQLINSLIGESKANYWLKKLGDNGKLMLPIFLLIPIFPDELICLIAGLSSIRFAYFLTIVIFTRAIDLSFTCFIGTIIPFHGWWLLLWGTLLILTFVGSYYLAKYQESLQKWVESFVKKKKLK